MSVLLQGVAVASGGALGALARWQVGLLAAAMAPQLRVPIGTLAVNLAGCLMAGLVLGLLARAGELAHEWRLFLLVGVLGGFTTFSAFGIDTLVLLRRGDAALAAGYVLASVLGGVLAVAIGLLLSGARLADAP